ncbi:peroxisome biogenesis protein 3-2-like [Juglans microcarpa x Juglans regia]|uniref:peroxisome biogenesis protein 3-2-like n=1 Tax=Juglans microcarpa x Juglans regia TaxID=2249226 RepID=UPI001B7E6085|nr:peroxisome biogenesis protein 3-2-like [Juglans microcarpa x Juglans regia]XP_040998768.1 peroxisome biogenesis protein 3-2-like [Juglans microcarpa x Juglans regia]
MLSLRNFWRRYRRTAFVTVGVLGSGYFLYKLYNAKRHRVAVLERELAEREKFVKAQMQAHFDNIQRIADTTTLPHAMDNLSRRIAEELDHSQLTERLQKAKGQPNSLTHSEKLELWDRIKILSFTRMVLSLWAMTMLSLYIRVQVNILGRHLYINTARDLGGSYSLANADTIDRDDEQMYLASADFLSNYGLPTLISDVQAAATEILEGKKVTSAFNTTELHKTIVLILERFKSLRSPHHWVNYMMPEDARFYKLATASSSDNEIPSEATKFYQLMMETQAVLASTEFVSIVEIALTAVLGTLIEDVVAQSGGSLTSGMALAKLLARVAQAGPMLLGEPSTNQFIQIIQSVPEVEVFFTLLYANIPTP